MISKLWTVNNALVVVVSATLPLVAIAQQPGSIVHETGRTSIALFAGTFHYNRGDGLTPYVSLRTGHQLTRYLEGEVGLGYSRVATRLYSFTPTIQTYKAHAGLVVADIALNASLPLGRFAPYVGISAGVFRRGESRGWALTSVKGTSLGGAAGMKVLLSERIGIRGELRLRGDRHEGSTNWSPDAEQVGGLFYRF